MKTLLNYGFEAIEIGGRNIVLYVNNVFKKNLPFMISATEDTSLIDVNTVIRFISISWESCFELRKLEVFWKVYNSWIEMVFQQEIIINSKFTAQLVQYIDEIFKRSESVPRLTNVLISHLHQEITVPSAFVKLAEVLIKAIIFGPVHRKDLRIENETCLYIKSHGDALSVNVLKPLTNIYEDSEVRLKTADLIIKLSSTGLNDHESDVEDRFNFIRNLIRQLIEHDNFISSKKQRYFNDSLHHRVKNRILQSLLLFQHLINIDSKFNSKKVEILHEEIINWVSNNLSKESHQPSVRYQLEWLLIRCILSQPQFIENFWNIFVKGSEERAGSVCSFISVAYHLASMLNKASFTERSIEEILPWCMAQNFNIRLYSQVALIKLFELYTIEDLPFQYKVIKNSLTKSIKQGTAVRNAPKLMSDFYFNVFHPIKHFSLKSLFCDMPRLSSISHDECITDDNVLINCFTNTLNHGVVPLHDCLDNSNGSSGSCKTTKVSLSECEPASWTVKVRGSSEQQNVESDTKVIQKKFVPWNVMEMDDNENDVDTENNIENLSPTEDQSSVDNNDGLIIIASLIDRPPNLGGLSRTCEVFNVKQLVLNSLQYVKDKQFTSLSMSSEKHINITEVKQHHLKDYLLTMKQSHNYYLVGAEQTATGVKLNEFKFPVKTIVLLGNEKEGIPADLLPLLDICVEVPQFGVIRSLNVHVTGAIFVWEYAKQHKYKS